MLRGCDDYDLGSSDLGDRLRTLLPFERQVRLVDCQGRSIVEHSPSPVEVVLNTSPVTFDHMSGHREGTIRTVCDVVGSLASMMSALSSVSFRAGNASRTERIRPCYTRVNDASSTIWGARTHRDVLIIGEVDPIFPTLCPGHSDGGASEGDYDEWWEFCSWSAQRL